MEFLAKFNLIKSLESQRSQLVLSIFTVALIGQLENLLSVLEEPLDTILTCMRPNSHLPGLLQAFSLNLSTHLSRIYLSPNCFFIPSTLPTLFENLSSTLQSVSHRIESKKELECMNLLKELVSVMNEEVEQFIEVLRLVETWNNQICEVGSKEQNEIEKAKVKKLITELLT